MRFSGELPILNLFHRICNTTRQLRYVRHKDANNPKKYPKGTVATSYSEKLLAAAAAHNNAQKREVMFHSTITGTVYSHGGRTYVVDLTARRCSCGKFQNRGIPCAHAVSFIRVSTIDSFKILSPLIVTAWYVGEWKCTTRLDSREPDPQGLSGHLCCQYPPPSTSPICSLLHSTSSPANEISLPPVTKRRKPGRPATKRKG
jgi:hypothetical protein